MKRGVIPRGWGNLEGKKEKNVDNSKRKYFVHISSYIYPQITIIHQH
jgi:hypothetical protein